LDAVRSPRPPTALSYTRAGALQILLAFPTRRSSDLGPVSCNQFFLTGTVGNHKAGVELIACPLGLVCNPVNVAQNQGAYSVSGRDRKSTRLNSSHVKISYAVVCLKKQQNSHTLRSAH